MKFRWDKKYLHWGVTAFCVIACSLLFYWLVTDWGSLMSGIGTLLSILSPVLYALVFAFLLAPVCNFVERKWFGKLAGKIFRKPRTAQKAARGFSVALSMIFGLSVVAALLYLILPQTYDSVESLVVSMPGYIELGTRRIESWLKADSAFGQQAVQVFNGVYQQFTRFLSANLLPVISSSISAAAVGVFKTVFNIFVGIVITVYLLCSKEHFIAQCKKLAYCIFPRRFANSLVKNASLTHTMFGNYITARLIDSTIVGIVNYIVMLILGLHYPALISVIVGVTNIIPFFGPYIGAIPSALLLLIVDPVECLIFIVYTLILQQLDGNVLAPLLLGNRTGLNSFWVMVALLVGGGLFGFVGMICAVPLFAVLFTIVHTIANEHLERKGLPTDTGRYYYMKTLDTETGEPIPFENAPDRPRAMEAAKEETETTVPPSSPNG
ncbi:MAG: AI-2E family transporter [Clostridia bacterium]|nr:AI-2E family transporter [Clostridia bacterium]